ncbi:MAG: M56 family metallopeptidase, partial [Acidobacteriota bacterium]|nr:M56 family metallopeptidase [Acidobacteriota bacterium]
MILPALSALWTSVAPKAANHLWQSTLFAAVAGLLAWALRKNQARVRYWIWMAASLKFLIPFSLLITIGSYLATPQVDVPAHTAVYSAIEEVGQPFAQQDALAIYQSPQPTTPSAPPVPVHLLPALLVAVWLSGVIAVLLVWATSWIRVSIGMREAVPLGEGREIDALRRLELSGGVHQGIKLLLSRNWMEPGIFGIVRPVLIWPAGISQHLDDGHIEAILAHEMCHVSRRDNLTAFIHMLVEAIFWFHPLVWWVGGRLEEERERACDEEVMLLCKEPHVYAESILKVCKFCSESPLACVSGITGADLKKRIVKIMTEHIVRKLDFGRKLLLLAVGLAAIAVPIMLGQVKAAHPLLVLATKPSTPVASPTSTPTIPMLAAVLPQISHFSSTQIAPTPTSVTSKPPMPAHGFTSNPKALSQANAPQSGGNTQNPDAEFVVPALEVVSVKQN